MRSRAVFLLCGLVILFFCSEARANGIIVASGEREPGTTLAAWVKEAYLDVEISDQIARTLVTEVFVNPTGSQLEGDFIFPLPEGAAVTDFSFWMNGREVKGRHLDASQARDTYTSIVRRLRDPALLEYVGRGLVRLRIFPIPPYGAAKVKITYSQVLKSRNGVITYSYPYSTNKYSSRPLERTAVKMKINSRVAIKSVYCPTVGAEVVREGDHKVRVGCEGRNVKPDRDFTVHYATSEEEFGVSFLTWREKGEDGYFIALISPGQELAEKDVVPKDIVFAIDSSASMEGKKLVQARRALKFCVNRLNPRDRFNIVQFATGTREFADKLTEANKENVGKACEWIDTMQARGATNIEEALWKALRFEPDPRRTSMVIFVTDGQPTYGEKSPGKILESVRGNNTGKSTLFVFGVGYDVNTVFLDALAQENGGTCSYVGPAENLQTEISSFFNRICNPVLADVKIEFEGLDVRDVYPRVPGHIFRGEQVAIVGRYRGEGRKRVKLSGTAGRASREIVREVDFPALSAEVPALPRTWAAARVGSLIRQVRLLGFSEERRRQLVGLSRRFGVLTPYTSYLVVEDEYLRGGQEIAARSPASGVARALREDRGALARLQAQMESEVGAGAVAASRMAKSLLENGNRIGELTIQRDYFQQKFIAASGRRSGGGPVEKEREVEDAGSKIEKMVRQAGAKTFYLNEGFWTDSLCRGGMEEVKVGYLSDEYFELLSRYPLAGRFFAVAAQVVVVLDGRAYRVVREK